MTGQDLKNAILQLAIQGKLVEQREEEGSAKELLKKIRAEKDRLVKEKKIRKGKPLPEIGEGEFPFDIPRTWEWVRLGNAVKISNGRKDANYASETGEYKFFTCSKEPLLSKDYSFEGECILLPGNGANVGLSIYYNGKFEAYQRTYVLEKIYKFYNMRYLQIALEWNWKNYNSDKQYGSAIPYIKLGNLQNFVFPLPPLAEQKRIVEKVEKLMPYVEEYGQAYEKLEELNKIFPQDLEKSILQYAIQGKLVDQREDGGIGEDLYKEIQKEKERLIKEGELKKTKPLPGIKEDEIPFDIPESWKWLRLGEIFQINPRNNLDDDIKVSFIPMKLLEEGYKNKFTYDIEPWRKIKKGYTHFRDNDIVLAKITPCFQNLKSAIVEKLHNGFGAGTTELHVLRKLSDMDLRYFLWFLKSPLFISNGEASMTGTAGQQRVGADFMRKYLVPLPPLSEQKRIAEKIEEVMFSCKELKIKIQSFYF